MKLYVSQSSFSYNAFDSATMNTQWEAMVFLGSLSTHPINLGNSQSVDKKATIR